MKHLVSVVWQIAREYLDEAVPYEQLILGAIAGSATMKEILEQCKGQWVLTPGQAAKFSRARETLNLSLTELGLQSHGCAVALWNFTVKNHVLEHIAQECTEWSPRLTWNYGAESVLMHVRTVIQGNRSLGAHALQSKALRHWLHGFEMGLKPQHLS